MFTVEATNKRARAGLLKIGKKEIQTPFFMPVATKGTIKALTFKQLKETNTQCIISNGFILSLKPGTKLIRQAKGLHKLIKWNGGIFTDSGGFQILLKEFFVKHDSHGIIFNNPFTGKKSLFQPEDSIQIQNDIGSDVAMAFDDVPKYGASRERVEAAIERTYRWARRSLEHHRNNKEKTNKHQLIFGIAQGNSYKDLRERSAEQLNELDFDGFAIGGVAIGEPQEELYQAVDIQTKILDKNKPRYAMGVGSPIEILECIQMGVDCFDSIFPTQSARRGTLFSRNGPVRILNSQYTNDLTPIEEGCQCFTCKNYTKAYVRHLLKTHEYTAFTLVSIHNIHFLQWLVATAREKIKEKKLDSFIKAFKKAYGEKNITNNTYFHYNED